jgi:hypothetical protein
MSQTPFEKEFQMLRELGEKTFVLRGSTIIVYELPDEEIKTQGGLIIATDSKQVMGNSVEQHRLKVAKVLMTGPGYYQENLNYGDEGSHDHHIPGTYIPLEVKPGAIVILPQYSTSTVSTFPGILKPTSNKLHMVKEDSIVAYYPSEEAYELAKSKLN